MNKYELRLLISMFFFTGVEIKKSMKNTISAAKRKNTQDTRVKLIMTMLYHIHRI